MITWDDVRELALALPEVEESTSWRQPCFKVRGKWFTGMSPHEEGALVLKGDPDEKQLILESQPDVFYVTPHYEGWAGVLTRLDAIDRDSPRERLEASWLLSAPPKLARDFSGDEVRASDGCGSTPRSPRRRSRSRRLVARC